MRKELLWLKDMHCGVVDSLSPSPSTLGFRVPFRHPPVLKSKAFIKLFISQYSFPCFLNILGSDLYNFLMLGCAIHILSGLAADLPIYTLFQGIVRNMQCLSLESSGWLLSQTIFIALKTKQLNLDECHGQNMLP